jgi:hypothetical protein
MGDVMRDLREFWQHGGGPTRDTARPVMLTFWHPGHDCSAATVYGPLVGAHATLETTGDVHRRVTATRLLATGVFAFALKKKRDDRTLWLTIEGHGFQAVAEVDPKNERVARAWMAEFNTRAAQ